MGEASEKLLGKAIQEARQAAGLTQQELCQQAGLSYSTLAKIERGAIKTPSVFTVMRIANILGVGMDGLLGATVDTTSQTSYHAKRTSKSGISFLYLDINGCLVHFFHSAFTKLSAETGVSSEVIESTFWHYNDAVCRGEMTLEEFNGELAKKFGLQSIDWTHYYMDAVEPIKETHEVLVWASKHYKVGLLSNIMPGFIDSMIQSGLLPNINYDAIIDSSQVGAIKPEADIYKIAEGEAGVPPEQILFVDDSRTNLMAADRQGWKVLWFDDYRPADTVTKIRTILEL
jgi:FMN phosphatase YigB (HAD superfamily)/lambda repressor-like predicted transcriptional regulator